VLTKGTNAPQYAVPTKTIYTTTDANDAPLSVQTKPIVQQIPAWLK
jgi:hypothetical protein